MDRDSFSIKKVRDILLWKLWVLLEAKLHLAQSIYSPPPRDLNQSDLYSRRGPRRIQHIAKKVYVDDKNSFY